MSYIGKLAAVYYTEIYLCKLSKHCVMINTSSNIKKCNLQGGNYLELGSNESHRTFMFENESCRLKMINLLQYLIWRL